MDQLIQELREKGSVRFTVKVHPGAKATRFKEIDAEGAAKIDVKAPAEGGKANSELIRFLAKQFGVPKRSVEINSGLVSRKKIVTIR